APRTRTPTGCCASTSRRERTSPAGASTTSSPFRSRSTADPGRSSGGRPLLKSSMSSYDRYTTQVLQRLVELGQYTSVEFTNRLADWDLTGSYGSVGDAYDNAAMETFWATLKREIRHIWGPWETLTRSELRTILFDYIEVF